MAKRNKMSDVLYTSQKVLMWERFDWTKKTRNPTQYSTSFGEFPANGGKETRPPQWNNTEAEPSVVVRTGASRR
jgi:hypothetical protein